jgi:hypothetical protein
VSQITNASIFEALPENCTSLRALSLSRCRISDKADASSSTGRGGLARLLSCTPQLAELGLGRCKRISDHSLATIGSFAVSRCLLENM